VSDATAGPLAARVLSSRRIDRDLLKNDTAAPDEKGRWHHKLQEECADVNGLVNDDATHVGDRGDGGCGRKRCREEMQGEKTDAGHPKRYLPGEPRGDLQQIGEGDGLSGSSHGAISIREVG
jgi:hypothetical protein